VNDDYRRRSHEIWEAMAPGWERRQEWTWEASHLSGEWMVEKLDPREGETVLELAAGTGETGFAAAAAIGDDGKLISTDFSPQMVEAARRRATELGLGNCEFRVMDAEHMDLPDDSVDGVLCRWGYMLMADPAAALAETRRVLRDDGRLAFSVWGDPDRNPWRGRAGEFLVERGHMPAPAPGTPGIFALADPERVRELVTAAGFTDPELEEVEVEWRFEDFDDYWEFIEELVGGISMVLRQLSDADRAAVREAVSEAVGPFERNGGYVMPGITLNAFTRPEAAGVQ
jgi:ubiquinone/menaquinone biosynthesis C-methylase UbiE